VTLFRHSSGRTVNSKKKKKVRTTAVPTEIRTKRLPWKKSETGTSRPKAKCELTTGIWLHGILLGLFSTLKMKDTESHPRSQFNWTTRSHIPEVSSTGLHGVTSQKSVQLDYTESHPRSQFNWTTRSHIPEVSSTGLHGVTSQKSVGFCSKCLLDI
jgi:hypothetical protein